jgi:hypothetical protein
VGISPRVPTSHRVNSHLGRHGILTTKIRLTRTYSRGCDAGGGSLLLVGVKVHGELALLLDDQASPLRLVGVMADVLRHLRDSGEEVHIVDKVAKELFFFQCEMRSLISFSYHFCLNLFFLLSEPGEARMQHG